MIIKEIDFQNFKSFDDTATGKIQNLSLINLMFGNNSSGKSNILKFLNLLFKRKILRQTIEVEGKANVREIEGSFYDGTILGEPYIYHKNRRDIPITFAILLELSGIDLKSIAKYDIFIEHFFKQDDVTLVKIEGVIESSGDPYTSTIKLKKVSLAKQEIYEDTGKSKEYFKGVKGLDGEIQIFRDFMGIFNDLIFFLDKDRYLVSESENANIKELFPYTFKNWIHNLSLDAFNYKNYENFIGFVKKYGQLEVFKTFNPTFAKDRQGSIDFLISNGSERLPIESFGTGVQQMLLILAMIFDTKSKIILIEELELNFSPKSQQLLLLILSQLLNDKKIDQVILTSHSETLASTANLRTFEISIVNGVSSVKIVLQKGGKLNTKFFNRNKEIDDQMAKSYIKDPPGDEWE